MKKVELIEWYDAAASNEWLDVCDVDASIVPTKTCGFVVKETVKQIVVCATYDVESDAVNACMYIPKAMIKKRRVLWDPMKNKKR